MNASQKITRLLNLLQEREKLHPVLHDMLRWFTNRGFLIAREAVSIDKKRCALEDARHEMIVELVRIADAEGIEVPPFLRPLERTVPHADG